MLHMYLNLSLNLPAIHGSSLENMMWQPSQASLRSLQFPRIPATPCKLMMSAFPRTVCRSHRSAPCSLLRSPVLAHGSAGEPACMQRHLIPPLELCTPFELVMRQADQAKHHPYFKTIPYPAAPGEVSTSKSFFTSRCIASTEADPILRFFHVMSPSLDQCQQQFGGLDLRASCCTACLCSL